MLKWITALAGLLLAAGGVQAGQHAPDAVVIDPDSHVVVLENEHVRVIRNISHPGKTSPMHSHSPLVFISLSAARVKLTAPDGEESYFDLQPGMVMWWNERVEHAWELLAGKLHVIAVEVKSAAEVD